MEVNFPELIVSTALVACLGIVLVLHVDSGGDSKAGPVFHSQDQVA